MPFTIQSPSPAALRGPAEFRGSCRVTTAQRLNYEHRTQETP